MPLISGPVQFTRLTVHVFSTPVTSIEFLIPFFIFFPDLFFEASRMITALSSVCHILELHLAY